MKRGIVLTRIIAALCLLAMLISAVACTQDPEKKPDETDPPAVESESGSDEVQVTDPIDTEKYVPAQDEYEEGSTFTIVWLDIQSIFKWGGSIPNDMYIEEASQNVLAQAIYERGLYIKDEINVQLGILPLTGASQVVNTLKTDIMNGDYMYGLSLQILNDVSALYNGGYISDINKTLDTSYSWFDQYCVDTFTIKGKTFAFAGDMTFLDKLCTVAMFFNKQMVEDNGFEDLYTLVENDQWTFDKMITMSEQITVGPGDDEKWGVDDKYGVSSQNDGSYYFMHSFGIKTVDTAADGTLRYALQDEKAYNALQKIYTMMANPEIYFNRQATAGKTIAVQDVVNSFVAGNALFLVRPLQTLFDLNDIASMEDFGIIPTPMYNDQQDKYYTSTNSYAAPVLVLPSYVANADMTCDVINLMSKYSQENVTPALYEIVLGQRLVAEPGASKMLDIIFDNILYDFGFVWNLGSMQELIVTKSVEDRRDRIKSLVDSKAVAMGIVLGKFIDSVIAYGEAK